MKEQKAHTMSMIYDKLNEQPHIQDIIKEEVLLQLIKDEGDKATKNTIDELNWHIRRLKATNYCDHFWEAKDNHSFAFFLLWEFENVFNQ